MMILKFGAMIWWFYTHSRTKKGLRARTTGSLCDRYDSYLNKLQLVYVDAKDAEVCTKIVRCNCSEGYK